MALAFVESQTGNTATGSTPSTPLATTVVVGQLVVVTIANDSALTTSVSGVTDNLGNTYARARTPTVLSVTVEIWYARITVGGASLVVTVNWNTGNTARCTTAVQYFNGFTGIATLDQTSSATGTSTTASGGTTATTTAANEIVVMGAAHTGATTPFSLGTGYTNLGTVNVANAAVGQESKIVSATAAMSGTMGLGASRNWAGQIATFKDVPVSGLVMPVITSTATMYQPTVSQKAQTVTDNFNDNSRDSTIWTTSFSFDGTQVLEQNGRTEITHAATAQYNTLATLNAYDLTGSYFSVKLTNAGNQSLVSHEVIFTAYKDNNNKLYFDVSGNNLFAYKMVAGTQTQIGTSIPYSAVNHLYLRFIESGGSINMDTSPDGQSWTTRWTTTDPWAVTLVQALLQTGCYATEASGSLAYWDDFNIGGIAAQALTLPVISSTTSLFSPTLTTGAVTVTMPFIASTTAVFTPTIVPDAVTVALPVISSSAQVYVFTITTGVTIVLPLISATVVYAPTIVPAAVSITVPFITATTAVFAPTFKQNLTTPLITGTVVFAPLVTPGAVNVTLPALGPGSAVFAPTLRQNINNSFIASTTTLYAPTVGLPQAPITVPFITSTTVLYSFSISVQGPVITMSSFLGPTAVVSTPQVRPGAVTIALPVITGTQLFGEKLSLNLRTPMIVSSVVFYDFQVSHLNWPLTGWTPLSQPVDSWTPVDPAGADTWSPLTATSTDAWTPTNPGGADAWTPTTPPTTPWEVRT